MAIPSFLLVVLTMISGLSPEYFAALSIRFSSIYRGSIYADNDNKVIIPKNIILSLEASKGFNQLKFTAGIQNLLNAQYSDNVRINGFGDRYYEAANTRQGFVRMQYQL